MTAMVTDIISVIAILVIAALFVAVAVAVLIKKFSATNRRFKEKKPLDSEEILATRPAVRSGRKRSQVVSEGNSRVQVVSEGFVAPINHPMSTTVPRSVNYHFTRQCNYKCGFCFHTAKTSSVLPLEEAKQGLQMLKTAGLEKINFSGGEPFIHKRGEFVGELTRYCKRDLGLASVTIVCNGSLVTEQWFKKYGEFLDILAVSCDSFREETNRKIGRHQNGKNHLGCLKNVRDWCNKYHVAFKINTVVNTYNVDEDMNQNIQELAPVRWKVFQCLLIEGENCGTDALRDAEKFVISDDDFKSFVERHSELPCLVPESNEKMQNSYLILDEYMRFLDCTSGAKVPSKSLLDVGVDHAINASGFDEQMFLKRGGKYTWSKADMNLEW